MQRSILAFVAVLVGVFGSSSSIVAAPFQNGSFESSSLPGPYQFLPSGDTSLTGWTVTDNGIEWAQSGFTGPGYLAHTGSFYIDVAGFTTPGGGIQQSFDTIPGDTYAVRFAAGNAVGFGRDGSGILEVSIAGATTPVNFTFADATSSPDLQWFEHGFTFVAGGPTATVKFFNGQNPLEHFAALDSVSVRPIPENAPTVYLLLFGMVALVCVSRSRRCSDSLLPK